MFCRIRDDYYYFKSEKDVAIQGSASTGEFERLDTFWSYLISGCLLVVGLVILSAVVPLTWHGVETISGCLTSHGGLTISGCLLVAGLVILSAVVPLTWHGRVTIKCLQRRISFRVMIRRRKQEIAHFLFVFLALMAALNIYYVHYNWHSPDNFFETVIE